MSDLNEAMRLLVGGNLPAAEASLNRILASEPTNGPARGLLGTVYARTKRYAKAIETLESVLQDYPEQPDLLVRLASVKSEISAHKEAVQLFERALRLNPKMPVVYNALGMCYLALRQPDLAVGAFKKAVQLAPAAAPVYHNLGLALRMKDLPHDACAAFQQAVDLDPNNEGNYIQLYREQLLVSAWDDAIATLEHGLAKFPDSVALKDGLAMCYCRTNQKQRGEALFKQILEARPGFCNNYSLWLQEEGRFQESVALIQKWVDSEPLQGLAYYNLAEAKAFNLPDGSTLTERATAVQDRAKLSPLEQMYLAYALGKAYDYQNDFEPAIKNFDRANELAFQIHSKGRCHDFDSVKADNDYWMSPFTPKFVKENQKNGSSDSTPIFIVGMIRSGTTLLDQILSSHPQISSAGELPFWRLKGAETVNKWLAKGFDPKDLASLERQYLDTLIEAAGPSKRITDKQPLNYEFLGLISLTFPKAKIVHIRRNPVDTCLSIYFTHFGNGPKFAYSQKNIVFNYREYLRFMDHWRAALPAGQLLEVDYEAIVTDREAVTRQILDFCELPWNDACLFHNQNDASVVTPSRWQARQPIYATSVDKWRHYEPWLGGLLELQDIQHPQLEHAINVR